MFRPQNNIIRLGVENLFKQENKIQNCTYFKRNLIHIFVTEVDISINDVFINSCDNFAVVFL